MNLNLIIEALELVRNHMFQKEAQICEWTLIDQALAEARKMQEPCVWKRVLLGTDGGNEFYGYKTTCDSVIYGEPIIMGDCQCLYCGRKAKYED